MPSWLDPGKTLQLLRGSDAPASPPHSETIFNLLSLIVICGMLFTVLITSAMHLWYRRADARRLKRRIGAAGRKLVSIEHEANEIRAANRSPASLDADAMLSVRA